MVPALITLSAIFGAFTLAAVLRANTRNEPADDVTEWDGTIADVERASRLLEGGALGQHETEYRA